MLPTLRTGTGVSRHLCPFVPNSAPATEGPTQPTSPPREEMLNDLFELLNSLHDGEDQRQAVQRDIGGREDVREAGRPLFVSSHRVLVEEALQLELLAGQPSELQPGIELLA